MGFGYSDWNKQYKRDKLNNRAIIIDNYINFDKNSMQGMDGGIFSPSFGPTINIDTHMHEYSCNCGNIVGKFHKGEICPNPECESEVIERFGADIERFGWIELGDFYVINPGAFAMLEKIIGVKTLERILDYKISIDLDGQIKETDISPKNPFSNIGMIDFRKRFKEIIMFYTNIRNREERAKIILSNMDKIFVNVIAVLNPSLRPAFVSTNSGGNNSNRNKLHFDEINRSYTGIVSNVNILKKRADQGKKAVLPLLYSIQKELKDIYNLVIKSKISKKTGVIRSKIVGGRMRFSSRMIIVSRTDEKSKMDEISVSYKVFIELYRLEIINCLLRGYGGPRFKNMTFYEVDDFINEALSADIIYQEIWQVQNILVQHKKPGLYCILNRNPTIDLGSIQVVRISEITKDPHNLTMGISLSILDPFTADFDGDVLNLFSLKEDQVMRAFVEGFNPRNLILDRTGGENHFNSSFGLFKDLMLNSFSMVDSK